MFGPCVKKRATRKAHVNVRVLARSRARSCKDYEWSMSRAHEAAREIYETCRTYELNEVRVVSGAFVGKAHTATRSMLTPHMAWQRQGARG
eukprot:7616822-Alexandrium_andersonii.AAC.1